MNLLDYLNIKPVAPVSGFGTANSTPATLPKKKTASSSSLSQLSIPAPYIPPTVPANLAGLSDKIAIGPNGTVIAAKPPVAAAPVSPSAAPIPTPAGAGPEAAPVGPQGANGAAPASQSPVPPQYLNPDGSFKTPDQVAATMGSALKSAHGNGDVGTLALEQFGGGPKTTAEAEAAARRTGNARNDIAVGETDPYKVASESGIAYTPAELSAIEKAYAGIYDPALDTALAKVNQKQQEDQVKAQADAQAKQPFTLGKDQVRYDGNGNPIAVGISSDSGASGTYVKGQNPVVDAYVTGFQNGTYKASDIPDTYKDLVAQGIAAGTGSNAPLSKTSTDALGIIHQLQNSNDLGLLSGTGIVGSVEHPSSLFPGTKVQPLQNLAKQLQATLSLANRTQLKGQGAISDFEFRVLGDAASNLGLDANGRTNLSEADFKKGLANLELKLQVGPTNLTDDEVQYLASPEGGGFTPDEIRAYSAQQSFNDVGNTKASPLSTTTGPGTGNIPQRNNNPGNVKAGGLADALAVGKDKYGHLIFPDAATGFKALAADLTAKMKGTAKLPPNPTIAQLGAVYAEDPNWPKKVASILGVPVDTHTAAVPLDKLIQAVATQEGFYA